MQLLMRKGGQYEIHVDGSFYAEIIKFKGPLELIWGRYCRRDLWVLRRYMETFEGKKKYTSLKALLLMEFPVGFTNYPGPNKILEKVYG